MPFRAFLFPFLVLTAFSSQVRAGSLVAYWPLDSLQAGATPDVVSGYDFEAVNLDASDLVTGLAGQAIRFQASTETLLARSHTAGEGLPANQYEAFTVSFWVKGDGVGQRDLRVFSEGSSDSDSPLFNIGTDNGGDSGLVDVFLRPGSDHRLSSKPAFDDQWHHLAWVQTDASATLYIDGFPESGFDRSEIPDLNITSLGGIRRSGGDSHWFTGVIDEVSIWSDALAESDVAALAKGATPLEVENPGGNGGGNGGGPDGDQLLITEFLASNNGVLMDSFDDFPDWVELYNPTQEAIQLEGYFLTDEETEAKWAFPLVDLAPGAYLVVFASGQDVTIDGELHTNFKLSRSAGGYLALLDKDGQTVLAEYKNYPEQRPDISYGRGAEEAAKFYKTPSPGAANRNGIDGFVADTVFSHDRGFYEAPFDLEITSASDGVTILYTLDGTPPKPGSLFTPPTGTVYEGPVPITTTTTVRAMAMKTGSESTNIDTQTYLFLDNVVRQPKQPEGWPDDWGTDGEVPGRRVPDYEMDPRVVDSALPGYWVKEALLDIPSLSLVMDPEEFIGPNGIYIRPRERFERGGSLELLNPDGSKGFQVDCAVEIHGNSSRRPWRMQKHSIRVSFKSEDGPSRLNYPVIPGGPAEDYNKLILRACFTDSWGLVSWGASRYRPNDSQYIRDVWMKESMGDMGNPTTYGTFMHLYVNGLYWGLVNPAEKIEAETMASHDESDPDDWDVMTDFNDLVDGSRAAWSSMFSAARTNLAVLDNYEAMLEWFDPENFADYMLLHFYADAEDWPHHNGSSARNRAKNGTFKWFVWDQEIVLDNHNMRRFDENTSNAPGELFQRLRESDEFKLVFNDRINKHLYNGGALTVEASQGRYRRIAAEIDKAIVAESARWGDTQMSTPYGNSIDQPSNPNNVDDPHYPPAPNGPSYYFTREDSWVVERDNIINNYIPAILDPNKNNSLLRKLESEDLLIELGAPGLEPHGGVIPAGTALAMAGGANFDQNSSIYYTIDGSDPRLLGGQRAASAITYETEITLDQSVFIRARVQKIGSNPFLRNGEWGPLTEAFYRVGDFGSVEDLLISEIHYQPAAPSAEEIEAGYSRRSDFEFVELFNAGDKRVILEGVHFSDGLTFSFVRGSFDELAPGAYVLLVSNAEAFAMRYGEEQPVAGVFQRDSRLANGGERLALSDPAGTEFFAMSYLDSEPWPVTADGGGFSLVLRDPAASPDVTKAGAWSASSKINGSPGAAESEVGGPEGYEAWKQKQFTPAECDDLTISGPEADPDQDQLANLVECGVGSHPKVRTPAVLSIGWSEGKPVLRYQENMMVSDVALRLETSADFLAWDESGETLEMERGDSGLPGVDSVRATYEGSLEDNPQQFFRLKAVLNGMD